QGVSPQALAGTRHEKSRVDPAESLLSADQAKLDQLQERRAGVASQQDAFKSFVGMINDLDASAIGLKTPQGFQKLAVESSHPDIISGTIAGSAAPGSYELEVGGLAK